MFYNHIISLFQNKHHTCLISIFLIKALYLSVNNFPEHLNSPPVFSGVRVTRSLV